MDDFSRDLKNKFKELSENKGRIFGLVYPYIFTIILALGLLYVTNLNDIARRNIPAAVPDTTTVRDLSIVEARTIPAIDINTISKPTSELTEKGRALYANACASCHGENGLGAGPAATGLNPPPRNFAGTQQWRNGRKISEIYKTLEEGIPGTAMISYEFMSPEEKISLAHYMRSSFIPNPPADTQEDLANLDLTYNLSQGKEVAAQIPVSTAMNIMLEENKSNVQRILDILSNMAASGNERGYRIFNEVTINKVQAAGVLYNSKGWKENKTNFINIVSGNANRFGFNEKANRLNAQDWDEFYRFMSRYF
jgi:mono/diheme cytochrome c family protein